MRMFQVDAFTDEVFSGNPAAVLVVEDWPSDGLLLSIAQENNLSETAFARRRAGGSWDLRWFAPAHEVDFCGHATLATAHVLMAELGFTGPVHFHTRVGELSVSRRDQGYAMDLPCLPPEPLSALPVDLAGLLDAPPSAMFRNFENLFVDLGSADAVRDFKPDQAAIARLSPAGLAVTGQGASENGADFVSRYFAPGAGIPEDPVTGSIHATLVPYWADRLCRAKLRAYQASARGGWLGCELIGDRVCLVGNAVTFMEATLRLPPVGQD